MAAGGGGGHAGGVRAGKAFVEIYANNNPLSKGLQAARRNLQSFGHGLSKIGAGIFGLGAAGLAGIGGIFSDMVEHFSSVQDAADRLGSTTEAVSALGYAADQSGASMDDMETAAKKMQQAIGNGDDSLKKLGLSAKELEGMSLDEQFAKVGGKINELGSPAAKTAAAMDIFGKSGTKLLPMLRDMDELLPRAKRVGDVIDGKDAANAEQFGDLLSDAWKSIKNTVRELAAALLGGKDTFKVYLEQFVDTLGAVRAWIKENRQLILMVFGGILAFTAFGAAVVGLGVAISTIGTILGALGVVIGVIKAAFLALFSPIGFVLALLAGLGYLFFTQTEAGQAALGAIGDYFNTLVGTATTAFGAIKNALMAGRLDLAWKVITTAFELEWARVMVAFTKYWNAFKSVFVDAWHEVVHAVKGMWEDMTTWMAKKLVDVLVGLKSLFGADALKAAGIDLLGDKDPEEMKKELDRGRRLDRQIDDRKFKEEQRAREEFRAQDMTDAENAFKTAQDAFAQAVKEANDAKAPEPEADKPKPKPPPGEMDIGSSAGAFQSGNFRQLLGGNSSLGKQQLAAAEKTNEILKDIKDKIGPLVVA